MATNNSINAGNETSGKIYQAKGAAVPDFSTAIYPDTTTANQILYSSAANTVAGITTANNKLLTTNGSGVPSLTNTYITGTWTPVLEFGGGTTGITYTTQIGYYVRFYDLVEISMKIVLSSKGTDVGAAKIDGLPMNTRSRGYLMKVSFGEHNLTLDANYTHPHTECGNNDNFFHVRQAGSGQPQLSCDDTNFSNTSELSISMTYTRQTN